MGVLEATGSLRTTKVVHETVVSTANGTTISNSSATSAQALYAAAAPGVVDITANGVTSSEPQSPFGGGPPSSGTATGTGFVVDNQVHIVTAAHVVEGASSVTVKLANGTTRRATVLGQDNATDVAVLKIDATSLTLHPLTLGSSSGLRIGDSVAAIGDPFGYQRSFSTGIVSGLDRTIQAPNGFTVAHAIQTDTALNPGNSGGPVLNGAGQVIGIVDQIATDGSSDQSSGVGFAVPIDLVKAELPALEAGEHVAHAYIGVETSATSNGANGALIQQVTRGGPASAAGIQSGDIVTAIDGHQLTSSDDLATIIAGDKPGDRVTVTVLRAGETQQISVTLGTQPGSATATAN